jgi:hypothetical protein
VIITRPDDFNDLRSAYVGRFGIDPNGQQPPYAPGDILHYSTTPGYDPPVCCFGKCKGPGGDPNMEDIVVWECQYDTSDRDWIILASHSVDDHEHANYNYENYQDGASGRVIRFVKVGTVGPPLVVPKITTPQEAAAFLDDLHREVTSGSIHQIVH